MFIASLYTVWPVATLTALVLVFGAYALVDGLLALIVSRLDRYESDHGWVLLMKPPYFYHLADVMLEPGGGRME